MATSTKLKPTDFMNEPSATDLVTFEERYPARKKILNNVLEAIGNTPLIKIKSLSEFTGCDILAKAEVWKPELFIDFPADAWCPVSKWGGQ